MSTPSYFSALGKNHKVVACKICQQFVLKSYADRASCFKATSWEKALSTSVNPAAKTLAPVEQSVFSASKLVADCVSCLLSVTLIQLVPRSDPNQRHSGTSECAPDRSSSETLPKKQIEI